MAAMASNDGADSMASSGGINQRGMAAIARVSNKQHQRMT